MNTESEQLSPEAQPFTSFQTLTGVVKGQTKRGINEVKRYLKAFRYYKGKDDRFDNAFDEKLESALKSYQRFFRLQATGKLDADTVKKMSIPRCGVPDPIHPKHAKKNTTNPSKSHKALEYSLPAGEPKWPRSNLTYTFNPLADAVPLEVVRAVFASAFQSWTNVCQLTFREASSDEPADIVIGFYSGDHEDCGPFEDTVFAHAFLPTDGRFHYNLYWQWSTRPSLTQADLESVAMHEIGHLLGLDHSEDPNAIMHPTYEPGVIKRDLQPDDRAGIHALYPQQQDKDIVAMPEQDTLERKNPAIDPAEESNKMKSHPACSDSSGWCKNKCNDDCWDYGLWDPRLLDNPFLLEIDHSISVTE